MTPGARTASDRLALHPEGTYGGRCHPGTGPAPRVGPRANSVVRAMSRVEQASTCSARRNGRENSAIKINGKHFFDFVVVARAHPNIQC